MDSDSESEANAMVPETCILSNDQQRAIPLFAKRRRKLTLDLLCQ